MGSAVVKPLTRRRGKIKANDQVASGRDRNREEDPGNCEPHVDYKVDSLADPVSNLCKPVSVKSCHVDAELARSSPAAGGKLERSGLAPYDSDEEPHPIQLARIECSKTQEILEKADKKARSLTGNKQNNDIITQGNAKQVSHVPHKPLADRNHPPASSENFRFRRITALFQKNGNSSWRSFRRKHQKEKSPSDDKSIKNPSNPETCIPEISKEPVEVNKEEKDVCCDARTPSPEYDELEDLAVVNPSPKAVDQPAQLHIQQSISNHAQEALSTSDIERTCVLGVLINTNDQPAPEKTGEQRSEVGHVIFITPSPSREHTCNCQTDQVFPLKLPSLENVIANLESVKYHASPQPEEVCCINVPDNANSSRQELPNGHFFKDDTPSANNSEDISHEDSEDIHVYEDRNEDSFEPCDVAEDHDTHRRYSTLPMSAFTSLWPQENIGANMPTLPEVEDIAESEGNYDAHIPTLPDVEEIAEPDGNYDAHIPTLPEVEEISEPDGNYDAHISTLPEVEEISEPDGNYDAHIPTLPDVEEIAEPEGNYDANIPTLPDVEEIAEPDGNYDAHIRTLPDVEEISEPDGNYDEDEDETNHFTGKPTAFEMQRATQHAVIEVVAQENTYRKENKSECSSRSSSAHSNNSSIPDKKPSQVSFSGRTSIRNSPQEKGTSPQVISLSESTSSLRNSNSNLQAATPSESKNSLSISHSNLQAETHSESKTSLQRCTSNLPAVSQSVSKNSLRSNNSNLLPVAQSHSKNSLQRCTSNLQLLSQSASKNSLKNSNCEVQIVASSDSKHSLQRCASEVQTVDLSESKTSLRNSDSYFQAVASKDSHHSLGRCSSNVQAGTPFSRPTSGRTCRANNQVTPQEPEIVTILQDRPPSTSPSGDRNQDLEKSLSDSHHHQNTPTPCPSLTNVRQSPSQKSVCLQEEDKVMSKQSFLRLDASLKTDAIRGRPASEKLYTPLGNASVLKSRPISASELYPLSNFLPHQNGPTKLPPINCAVTKVNRPTSAKQSVSKSEEFLPSSRPSSAKPSEPRPQSGYSRASSNHSRPASATGSGLNVCTGQWEEARRALDTRVVKAESHHGEGEQMSSKNDARKDAGAEQLDPFTDERVSLTSTIYNETKLHKATEATCEGGDGQYMSPIERCCMPSMLTPCISRTSIAASRSGEIVKPSVLPSRSGELAKSFMLPRLSSSATKEDIDSNSPPERPNSSRGPGSARVSWSESPTGEMESWREAYSHQALSLSHDQIGSIRQQLYEEGLKPAERDGGVAFFIPMTIDGLQPQANGGTISDRLTRSRKCSLNYEERLLLANINRQNQLHKRKEFAVKDIQNVKGATSGSDTSDRKQEEDFDIDWDGAF
ncbi:unnamed protein product [Lymnaea stagnalis]|uniref:Uncharacterized protein n=1 Tax=Lymnaea stagnalis TaxID=6523 RepID=A0AAV2HCQ4_LYMST